VDDGHDPKDWKNFAETAAFGCLAARAAFNAEMTDTRAAKKRLSWQQGSENRRPFGRRTAEGGCPHKI
jgi:hypothetical protein